VEETHTKKGKGLKGNNFGPLGTRRIRPIKAFQGLLKLVSNDSQTWARKPLEYPNKV
jgi:hypothetical protein